MNKWSSVTWSKQRRLVNSLSDRAQQRKREARHIRGKLGEWMSNSLGNLETLVWIFAMGSFWAARRPPETESGSNRRSMLAAINTSLFAWQMVNRQVSLAQPGANDPAKWHQ